MAGKNKEARVKTQIICIIHNPDYASQTVLYNKCVNKYNLGKNRREEDVTSAQQATYILLRGSLYASHLHL